MVQRRNTKEYVVPCLTVVSLFDFCSMGQAGMRMQNGLGETGGAGGEVYGAIVFVGSPSLSSIGSSFVPFPTAMIVAC